MSAFDEAVEAAAKEDRFWDGLTDEEKDLVRVEVRRFLTAAQPLLVAGVEHKLEFALDEAERETKRAERAEDRAEQAETQLAELREALEEIKSYGDLTDLGQFEVNAREMIVTARKALATLNKGEGNG